jgi:hypothetical protein
MIGVYLVETNAIGVYYNLILIAICTDLFIVVKTTSLLKKIKSLLSLTILLIVLSSCSTKQAPIKTTEKNSDIETIVQQPDSLSADERVSLAQTLTGKAAVAELIIAIKLYFQQEDYVKALWLADNTMPLIDEAVPNYRQEKIQLALIKISSLQQLEYYAESETQLGELAQFYADNDIKPSANYYSLLSTALQRQKRPMAALPAQLFAFSLTEPNLQNEAQIQAIWRQLQRLSQWQLELLALQNFPDSQGWLELTAIANKYGDNDEHLKYQLSVWQRKFKTHPANVIAKALNERDITNKTVENIAVILPLTGNQSSAGLAIQQGILASFDNDTAKTLHFVDSNTVNWYGLSNEFSSLAIDYVIGPLLKSNVDKYITYTSKHTQSQNDYMLNEASALFDPNNNNVVTDTLLKENQPDYLSAVDSNNAIQSYLQPSTAEKSISTLLLNMPASNSLSQHHTVLSMRPEDEAQQAAVTLNHQNYRKPIVLSQQNVVSRRIAQAFVNQWQVLTGDTIEVVYYNTGSQMQENIKASLAVDESKKRIDSLKNRLNRTIKTQTRNRRDIDMVYLVGTPSQTRLVKPYIEVNISPFAKNIPVFASSRSHNGQIDHSSNSDLKELTFTEIPWLLPKEQQTELAALSHELWPKRSDGHSRLFAMGYDSYRVINKVSIMQQAQYVQHWGQTGVLKLGKDNILTRSLLWGVYKNNKVVPIAME